MERSSQPTPYAEVNTVLVAFLADIRAILGTRFVGMYAYGSLALGDFDPRRSDIDLVIVTDVVLPEGLVAALGEMHARFNAGPSPWAMEVEALYIPLTALRRYDPAQALHPHIQRGETLVMDQIDTGWVPLLYILREQSIVLAGPDPRTLIDPVGPQDLRPAVLPLAEAWFGALRTDRAPLRRRGYQTFLVLTLCRILYTLEHGTVVTKPVAARWLRGTDGGRWATLLDRALAWRKDLAAQQPLDDAEIEATLALIDHTIAVCRRASLTLPPDAAR